MEPSITGSFQDDPPDNRDAASILGSGRKDPMEGAASSDHGKSGFSDSLVSPIFTVLFGLTLLAHVPIYQACLEKPFDERAGLILWIYSSVGVMLGDLWALVLSGWIIHRCFSRAPNSLRIGVGSLLLFALLGAGVFIGNANFGGGIAYDVLKHVVSIKGVRSMLLIHDLAAACVIVVFSYAIVLVTWDIKEQNSQRLSLSIQWIRNLMYTGAVVLALTVFEINRLLAAGVTKVPAGKPVVGVFTFGTGLVFALLLFFIFGPAILAAEDRLRVLLADAAGKYGFEKENWMIRNQLVSAPIQYLTAIGSIVLPLASAFLSSLLTAGTG